MEAGEAVSVVGVTGKVGPTGPVPDDPRWKDGPHARADTLRPSQRVRMRWGWEGTFKGYESNGPGLPGAFVFTDGKSEPRFCGWVEVQVLP